MTQAALPWIPRNEVRYGLLARALIFVAKFVCTVGAWFFGRFAGIFLIGVIVTVCFGVWAHSLVFSYVDRVVIEGAAAQGVVSPDPVQLLDLATWGIPPSEIESLIAGADGLAPGLLSYLVWPLQFWIVRDLVILGAIFGLFNVIPVYLIWWERKVAGRIQSRLGPMRVGGWHGWSQTIADGIKLILKEDLVPEDADRILYRAAPYFALIPAALAFVALPFGATYVFRDLDVGVIFILAMLGVEVVGVILAGWASNNKWSVYGAMREACQMVSYEIPMGMALLVPIVTAGTLSLTGIGEAQSGGWLSWLAFRNPFTFGAFIAYFTASLASCKRAPFDLPEAESELVAGFHTEYSGFRWSLFFFAEYTAMFVVCGLAVILFLGGWNSPFPASWGKWYADGFVGDAIRTVMFSNPIWFFLKTVFLLYVQIWIRWTLPRIRLDQVLYACVQVLLPLTMALVLGAALWAWGNLSSSTVWSKVDRVCNWFFGLVGAVFAFGFLVTAIYGFYNRRRLVGNLVVDARPAS